MTTSGLSDLTPEQRALLVLRLRRKAGRQAAEELTEAAPGAARRPDALPLSFSQQRLWLMDRWQPDNPAYHLPFAIRAEGRLDVPALRGSFDEIVRRHESLRTVFVLEGDHPVQKIRPPEPLPVPRIDLGDLPAERRLPEALRLMAEEARRPFDLARDLPLRAFLTALGPGDHAAVVTMHHIASDAWSIGVFVRELVVLYEAFRKGRPSPLPELPLQYADFALREREWMAGEGLAAQIDYWKRALAGSSGRLDLPADRPRPAEPSGRGFRLLLCLPAPLAAALAALARRQEATLFMVLLAAFQALLGRWAGQADVSVGAPAAGRSREELEGLIGFFVQTLVLRSDLSADPPFRTLLAQARESTLGAFAHQEVPFDRLVEELQPDRDPGWTPLFQVMLALQNAPFSPLHLPDLELSPLEVEAGAAMFDLSLDLREDQDRELSGSIEANADLFDAPTVERLLSHFRILLEGICANAGLRVSELPLLGEAERHAVVSEWNDTGADRSAPVFIHRLFAEHARRTPEAVALAGIGERWTYGELARHVRLLARRLRALGVRPEVRVGICAGRSPDRIAAVLAVLEAGGAFVPLDPEYPRERLAVLASDARLSLLLADEEVRDRLPEAGVPVLFLEDAAATAGMADGLPEPFDDGLDLDHTAYVIYTSGSTGRPKGVEATHRGIGNACLAWQAEYGPFRALLQISGFSFDVFVGDVVRALCSGAALVLVPAVAMTDSRELYELIRREEVDFADMVPALLHGLIGHAETAGTGLDVRFLAAGADVWYRQDMERAGRLLKPGARLMNSYGVAEASVDTSYFDVWSERPFAGAVVPIGRPLTGSRMLILDRGLRPVPIGVAGELCIGGPNVARGYLRRPELTAERFVPDPFTGRGERLYRTGDRVRRLPEGVIEILGRADDQVKVRGVRIELGEVEAALGLHPEVSRAVVVAPAAPADAGKGRRLVAFVVPAAPAKPEAAALREHLRGRLPEAMVPSVFAVLEALPLTPNGKVDRWGLTRRAAELGLTSAESLSSPPEPLRTPAEEIVAGIWCEVLGIERAGRDDDFFERGGHSLLAAQVASRLRSALGVEIPLRRLFESPTVEGLAAEVEAGLRLGQGEAPPPIRPAPRREGTPLPLSFAQERLWFLEQLQPGLASYHMPSALRLTGRLDPALLAWSLGAVVARHEPLRTRFPAVDGRPEQRICPPPERVLPVFDLSALPPAGQDEEARRLIEQEAVRPFDLPTGPPFRAALLRRSADEHLALLVLHHLVSDGWSMDVLIREIVAFYAALSAGDGVPLPPLPIQYADYAAWQRGWLRGEVLEGQLAFWRERLAGLPPVLQLPLDRPRPAVPSGRGSALDFPVGEPLAAALRRLARRTGATLFMTLLAGFQALLSRLSGQDDFAVGVPVAGRDRLETEGLIGLFVNTLVLRADLAGGPAFTALLARARESALAAYAHQDLPFERLVEELEPERSLSHAPLFQVLFALQNTPAANLSIPGIAVAPVAVDRRASPFDLSLQFLEAESALAGTIEHSSDLFDTPTVARMAGQLSVLLARAATDPDLPVPELPLLSEAERHQLQKEWNDTGDVPPFRPVHQLFEQQAERAPEAVALVFGEGELTYGELNRRANRLAHRLLGLGIEPGARVAACLRRSPELVIALLGIWKAGGVYLLLDPAYPRERLAFLIEDAGAVAVVTRPGWDENLPEKEPAVRIDLLGEEVAGEKDGNPGGEAAAGDPAYLLYTSGSTGRPKGVIASHGNLSGILLASAERLGWERGDTIACGSLPSFDAYFFELLLPLLAGGICYLLPPGPGLDVERWSELLPHLTRLHAVPAAMRPVVERARRSGRRYPQVRTLFTGGEAVPADLLAEMQEVFPRAEIQVLYGPTETTIFVTTWTLAPGGVPASSRLGRPVPGTEILVCDPAGRLVPLGVTGEIWIGGAGVTLGYAGREDLTAERFPVREGKRYYRTGDRARLLPWGDLEFLGRADDQVKIRGFRIEPGEVEEALRESGDVREVAVVAREDLPGGRSLVAYAVAADGAEQDARALRAFLEERLPPYMVPSLFVFLESLPRTVHGKVDRRALPRPSAAPSVPGSTPRSLTEELLAGLFAEVLERPSVGLEESFFELGGHSLLATRLMSRVSEAFRIELPVRALFEKPSVASLALEIEACREDGRAVAPPIFPVPRGRGLPLSFAQERLWFLERLQPGGSVYNVPLAVSLSGPLDEGALRAALVGVIARHEALRTRFTVEEDGRPVQCIEPPPSSPAWALPLVDLSGLPEPAKNEEALHLAIAEAGLPFDLETEAPLRSALLRLAPEEHLALLTLHHIASDAWSVGILVRELSALYRRERLPELAVQTADFAVWQRGWLQSAVLEEQLAFWRDELAGAPSLTTLPLDRARPSVQGTAGRSLGLPLDAGLAASLISVGRRAGATLFMTLLAAFDALLHRLTGAEDAVVGVPTAGRNRPEIEPLIGFFVNTLALRADLSGDPPFGILLGRVRETALDAFAHQDLPFEKLVAELRPERDLSLSPLFQILFQVENAPRPRLDLADGLTLSLLDVEAETAKLDLSLSVSETAAGHVSTWSYSTDLFDAATVLRAARQLEVMLSGIAADPDRRISDLPLLTEPERQQLLEWNATGDSQPEAAFPELFALQADRTPDAAAVICGDRTLTYAELAERSDREARRLIERGVGPESVVALSGERGLEMLISLLAVQKAGGAWLPLDPSLPEKRREQILESSGAKTVMTGGTGGVSRPRNLSYVIYTSGSTGVPKGVMVEQRGMMNHLRAKIADLRLTAADAVAQTASQAFDISVWQSLAALLAGGRVHVYPDEVSHDPARLLDALDRDGITIFEAVPSMLSAVLEILPELRPALSSLRWVIATGEALPPELARRWLSRISGVPLLNAYGPTEASDRVSHQAMTAPPQAGISIGRPILNLRLQVLDRAFGLLPIGAVGELCLGGTGVGRGYLRDPVRTAEAFVPDPSGAVRGEPGARLYRTGDLARFLPDGRLELLGRRDHQIKIRGFRIELGEVEAALRAHPAVREAVTSVRGGRLVAYVVPRGPVTAEELTGALRELLPAYMVPAALVWLDSLPLNRNGKLDRRALPDPAEAERDAPRVPPRTPFESRLAGMWADVLGIDPAAVGAEDNFFDLGGDSIKGAIFANRLQRALGEPVPVASLFDAPTVAALAAVLAERHPAAVERIAGAADGLPCVAGELFGGIETQVRQTGPTGPAPLSFAQERLWFLHQLDPEGPTYNMPQAFRVRGPLDIAALDRAFGQILLRHEVLRTRFPVREGHPAAVVEASGRALSQVDLAALGGRAEGEARRLATAEVRRPFDLEQGPVARGLVLRLSPQEHAVLFTLHHIACDGWSLGLWAREIESLYAGAPLAELPLQYADFARWQRSSLQGATLEAQTAYWRERLRGLPPSLDLPLDRPRTPLQSHRGGETALHLPAELADRLRSLGRRHNASLFMVLLAAFQLQLRRLSGQEDIPVGSPIAGRTRPEVEGLIGCFLNTLVLRTDLSGTPTFDELLRRVRETALGAFSYQDVPFEKLLEELRPQRDTSRSSLFQVLFNLLNTPSPTIELPGLEIEPFGGGEAFSKFDLTLYISEDDGLRLDLVYNADLFDAPRMEEVLRQYRSLLAQVSEAPEASIDRFSLLTPEAAAVLPDPTASLAFPWPGTVHDLFGAWAQRDPQRTALVDRHGEWTYGELDLAVRRLAARLQADGVRPGDRVAVYAHRGASLAWALLGILKAGAAFTILDPVYPAPRLVDRLRLAEPRGLIHLQGAGPLPEEIEEAVEACPSRIFLPEGGPRTADALADLSLPETWPAADPHDVASVAFTSGSTGAPKGIVQTHGSMSYFLPWHQEKLGYGEGDRHTMLSGLAHDPLQRDLFYCLGTGAALCIPDPDRIGAPGYLAGWMRAQRVTVTNLTPAMGQVLAELPPGAPAPRLEELRCVVLAGDLLTRLEVVRLRRLAPQAVFLNVYGSTESQRALSYHIVHIVHIVHAVEEDGKRRKQTLPLGRGKDGCQLLVLTPGGLRAGIGELGEVAIRSPHLAQGYLADEAQTREKFTANPFTGEPGDRIYRTGDLGRYLPDGEVEAAGRADQQVKIRGFRVEPGEIEAELGRLPGIRESVVVARTLERDGAGERQLVAYLVLSQERPASVSEIRECLRERLPSYMIPTAWVILDRLPINPNGKVDRLALPVPADADDTAGQARAVEPRDELEARLARIWEEVLGTGPVGVTDDFFDLGGHSLLAVRLTARIESELGEALPLAALFESGTIEGLAERLRRERPFHTALVCLQPGGSRPPLFLVHPAGGQVLAYSDLVRLLGPEQPVYALQDTAILNLDGSNHRVAGIASLAASYREEITAVQPHGPYYLAGWSFGGRVAFEMARQFEELGEEVPFLGMIDTGEAIPPPSTLDDVEMLRGILGFVPPEVLADLRPETPDPFGFVVEQMRRAGLLPDSHATARARRQLDVFKEHLEMARQEQPKPYQGRLTFFAAIEPMPEQTVPEEPTRGWKDFAEDVEVFLMPGDHVSMIYDRKNVRILAERLESCLERAAAELSSSANAP